LLAREILKEQKEKANRWKAVAIASLSVLALVLIGQFIG
jgi:hypothetical protein